MQLKKKSLVAITVSLSVFAQGSHASDWIGDFYSSAGAAVNYTEPQVLSSQNAVGMSGGGMSWRVPNKSFQLLQVTPPSLKAGCGGIDFYLGGYSFPNKAAFVNALRNFGQASVGYFFNLALKTMAPEIQSTLAEINEIAMAINSKGQANCALAKKAVDGIAEALYNATTENTANGEVAAGASTDHEAGVQQAQEDGYWNTVRKNYRQLTGKDRGTLTKKEVAGADLPVRNLLYWALGKAGSADLSESEKDLIMSLVGPSMIIKEKTSTDSSIAPDNEGKTWSISFNDLVGVQDPKNPTPQLLQVLTCADGGYECLEVVKGPQLVMPFANRVQNLIDKIRNGVATRSPAALTSDEKNILKLTSLPVARVAAMAESGGVGATVTAALLPKIRDLAAMEAASNFVHHYLVNAQRAIVESGASNKQIFRDEIARIEQRIQTIKRDMVDVQVRVAENSGDPVETVAQLERVEKFMYTNMNTMLAANARFKNKN